MDHSTSFSLLGFVAVVCITLGRPGTAAILGMLGLIIYLR